MANQTLSVPDLNMTSSVAFNLSYESC